MGHNKWWFIILAIVILLPLVWLFVQARLATRPADLGLREGQLRGCPPSPNCVSTRAESPEHQAEPLPYEGTAEQAMDAIVAVLGQMPSARIVSRQEDYLHAEFTSAVFRFVDDVEFHVDPQRQVVQYRSASRVGYSDLGANRQRMERFATRFAQLQTGDGKPPGNPADTAHSVVGEGGAMSGEGGAVPSEGGPASGEGEPVSGEGDPVSGEGGSAPGEEGR